ncbi:hypothetical protein [Massilia sp. TSP1-1-2]|uniref:hypothetical protein n=1 Tax=Massilia sp. TSP1-1-2 TaxID=2804649 RepID=UPI003CFAA95E
MDKPDKYPSIPAISSRVPNEIGSLLRPMREILTAFTAGNNKIARMGDLQSIALPDFGDLGGAWFKDGTDSTVPPMPTGLSIDGALANIMLSWEATTYGNLSHTEVWRAQTNDFSLAQLIGRGAGRVYVDNVGGAAVRYYWIRYVSRANIPGPFNLQAGTMGATGTDPAYMMQLLLNKLGYDQFDSAAGVFPVRTETALPVLPHAKYPPGVLVYLTTDQKIYRNAANVWTSAVGAADITGQLANAQIAALAASKITGQLTDAQVAAIAAAKVTGQIVGTQISDGSISTAKIVAGAITAAQIAADTITAAQIAAGAITTVEIAAGAITTAKIAAGNVTATELAAGSVIAGKIAAQAVTANELAANAIIAGKIAAGAIVAGDGVIANAAIGTAHIIDGTITNVKIGNAAVDNAKIANLDAGKITTGYMDAARILAGSIDAKIANLDAAVINSGFINSARINTASIANAMISNAQIVNGSIGSAQIANAAITLAKIDTASITSLSALSATIGLMKSSNNPEHSEMDNNGFRAYDANGTLRVRGGVW